MGLRIESVLSLNSSEFSRGLANARGSVVDFVKNAAVAAVGIGAINSAVRRTFETADELVNAADKMDMTVEQVQVLRKAAQDAGKEFEDMAGAIGKVNEARAKALGGDAKSKAAFTALGVGSEELKSKSGADILTGSIAAKIQSTNVEQIMLPLKEVLGKGGKDVVGVLKTDFKQLEADMRNAGAIMEDKVARQLDAIGDQFDTLGKILVSRLAPAILEVVKFIYKAMQGGKGGVSAAAAYVGGEVGEAGGVFSAVKIHFKSGIEKIASFIDSLPLVDKINKLLFDPTKTNFLNAGKITPVEKKSETATQASERLKSAGKKAAKGVWDDVLKELEDFEKQMENSSKSGAKKSDYSKVETLSSPIKAAQRDDSLIKVGNFLGASKGVIGNAQSMLAQHTAQTAMNTKRTADALDKINSRMNSGSVAGGSSNQTIWAAN